MPQISNRLKKVVIWLLATVGMAGLIICVEPELLHFLVCRIEDMSPARPLVRPPACTVKFYGAIAIVAEDQRLYVSQLVDTEFRKWNGSIIGKSLAVMEKQDGSHSCYAVIFTNPPSSWPDEYSILVEEAVIVPNESGSQEIITIPKHRQKPSET